MELATVRGVVVDKHIYQVIRVLKHFEKTLVPVFKDTIVPLKSRNAWLRLVASFFLQQNRVDVGTFEDLIVKVF